MRPVTATRPITWPSSARERSRAIGSPRRAGVSVVVLGALMSPPRPRRKRDDDQAGAIPAPSTRWSRSPRGRWGGGLGPEVVLAPSPALRGVDPLFTVRTG